MGHIKEPNGVTLVIEKQDLNSEVEQKIKDFIKKVRLKTRSLLKVYKQQQNDTFANN